MIAEERKLFFFCSFHLSGWPQPMQAYAVCLQTLDSSLVTMRCLPQCDSIRQRRQFGIAFDVHACCCYVRRLCSSGALE